MVMKLLQAILRFLAIKVIHRYQPKVIGITGSVGKTSTKEAVFAVLKDNFDCRANKKNYNNQLGVPLSILDRETGKKNPFIWLDVFWQGLRLGYGQAVKYPDILVLEMGADRIGDIDYLVRFTKPLVGVVTAVGPVHLEFFETIERVAQEKSDLVRDLPEAGWAILNADDDLVVPMREKTRAKVITFGFSEEAMIRGHDVMIEKGEDDSPAGLQFKITFQGSTIPVFLPQTLARHHIYSALAAFAVGHAFNLNAIEMAQALRSFRPPAGRMNLIAGIKGSQIIDDTYNSSPTAAVAALQILKDLPAKGARYAVLGDMAELGPYTEKGHQEVGEKAVECANYLVTVGERAKIIAEAAHANGFSKSEIYSFDQAEEAGRFLQDRIEGGDLLLVKGSQVVRLEKVVKELMAEPQRAQELLVRQGLEWV